jgi:hypothetical protein
MVHTLSHKVRMARLRVQKVQVVQDMLEGEAEVREGKIRVSDLKLTPNLR